MKTLINTLQEFQIEVNQNSRLKPLIQNWNRNIILECEDSGRFFSILVRDAKVVDILEKEEEIEKNLHVCAEEQILTEIFTGELNPSTAFLDGDVEVFGDDGDKIKLDAISLVIWGM